MTTIAVIDGMGGGIGVPIVTQLRLELPLDVEILALGANAVATDRMMQARASRGGQRRERDPCLPAIAEAVAMARGYKLLLPVNQPPTSRTSRSSASSGRR
jgi:hypothetical protein